MARCIEFSEQLDQLPQGLQFPDEIKMKLAYDVGKKSLVLKECLTERERDILLKLSPDSAYQRAINNLFCRSNTPPDGLKWKECDDKVYVTEELAKMTPVRHTLLAIWLIFLAVASVLWLINLWPSFYYAKQLEQRLDSLNTHALVLKQSVKAQNADTVSIRNVIIRIDSLSNLFNDIKKRANVPVLGGVLYTPDQILFLIAFLSGIIGGTTHGISSLMDFRGNRRLFKSWSLWYFALPIVSGLTGIIFYVVVRAGFVSSSDATSLLNPFGISAVSLMVGLFTDKATTKLSEIFETMFKSSKIRGGGLNPNGSSAAGSKSQTGTSSGTTTT